LVIGVLIVATLNLEEGGDMLQPIAAGVVGGLTLGIIIRLGGFLLAADY
jgi:hypothetical protein